MVGNLHRRSMVIEPKDVRPFRLAEARRHTEPGGPEERPKTASGTIKTARTGTTTATVKPGGQKFDLFLRTNLHFKSRTITPTPNSAEQE